jgi:hypothetical protein
MPIMTPIADTIEVGCSNAGIPHGKSQRPNGFPDLFWIFAGRINIEMKLEPPVLFQVKNQ